MKIKRQPLSVASVICAALAAQLYFAPAHAAVPIEESVEDSSREVQQAEPGLQQTRPRPSQQARSLDVPSTIPAIPPTIEPTVNTDYPASRSAAPSQAGTQVAVPGSVLVPTASSGNVAAAPVNSGGQSQLSELFYQLQILQQEIQLLRGQVEEQTYLVNRLQRDQKEQYLDLDRRVVALSENQPPPGPSSTAPATPSVNLAAGNLTEREAYTQAFEAMRSREFDASMAGFTQLIETYPNGQFTPNAYYWMGELYLVAKSDAELARQSFMQVVNLYPDHQKTPDAMYKLGVVYHTLGDAVTAKTYLDRVQAEHPNSSAAGLANKYAAEL